MTPPTTIRFSSPTTDETELHAVKEALTSGTLSGNGPFTKKCHELIRGLTGARACLLTQSCTSALEMATLLAGIGPGDEVILPSFTFVSTANAVALRGAKPVFVDIRADTLNIDETVIEAAITKNTKAIIPVHYAGIGCEMDRIGRIASDRGLCVIEDAAQALLSEYDGRHLGTFGTLGALSFHETKNVVSGEGGALLINDEALVERAEIMWEKGTNRAQFFRGVVDKYTWVDVGSSFLPSELTAAVLSVQLAKSYALTANRLRIWNRYHASLAGLERQGVLRRPVTPARTKHNAHMYYVLLETAETRDRALAFMREKGIGAVFHYIPLHSSPAGRRLGTVSGSLRNTEELSARLLRLPLYAHLADADSDRVVQVLHDFFRSL